MISSIRGETKPEAMPPMLRPPTATPLLSNTGAPTAATPSDQSSRLTA